MKNYKKHQHFREQTLQILGSYTNIVDGWVLEDVFSGEDFEEESGHEGRKGSVKHIRGVVSSLQYGFIKAAFYFIYLIINIELFSSFY